MKDVYVDKNVILKHLLEVENVILSYLENNKSLHKDVINILSCKKDKELIHILSIMEEELPKLKFNVNLKLWCDSFYSRLIGG